MDNIEMKPLLAIICVAILVAIGQQFWSAHQDDNFNEARADIMGTESASQD